MTAENFWSRRRAAVEAEERAEREEQEAAVLAEEYAALEEKTDEDILAELNLPEPETLEAGDDFSAFMAKAVPDRIRRRALRVLWKSNPILANIDQLVDYGEDFTDSAMVVENLQTAYQVGKGMLKHVEEMARQAEAEEQAQDTPELEDAPEEEPVEMAEVVPQGSDEVSEDETDEPAIQAAPRRMKFRLEETA